MTYKMDEINAIKIRISRRQFDGQSLSKELMSHLNEKIVAYNHESGLSIQLIEDAGRAFNGLRKSYGLFSGVKSLIVLKGATSDIYLKEKCGYFGERLVLEATRLGLGTCWVAGTFDKTEPIFKCDESESLICIIPIGISPSEATTKEKIIRSLSHRKSKPFERFINNRDLTELPDWMSAGIKSIMLAPSAVNSQPVYLELREGTLSIHTPDKKATDLVDLGIAKLHFELAAGGSFPRGNGVNFFKSKEKESFESEF